MPRSKVYDTWNAERRKAWPDAHHSVWESEIAMIYNDVLQLVQVAAFNHKVGRMIATEGEFK